VNLETVNPDVALEVGSFLTSRNIYIRAKVKVKFAIEHATGDHRWSRGIALLFL